MSVVSGQLARQVTTTVLRQAARTAAAAAPRGLATQPQTTTQATSPARPQAYSTNPLTRANATIPASQPRSTVAATPHQAQGADVIKDAPGTSYKLYNRPSKGHFTLEVPGARYDIFISEKDRRCQKLQDPIALQIKSTSNPNGATLSTLTHVELIIKPHKITCNGEELPLSERQVQEIIYFLTHDTKVIHPL